MGDNIRVWRTPDIIPQSFEPKQKHAPQDEIHKTAEAPRGPAFRQTPESSAKQRNFDTIIESYVDRTGEEHEDTVCHPSIIHLDDAHYHQIMQPDTSVVVKFPPESNRVRMPFDLYLKYLGASYERYTTFFRKYRNNAPEIFYDLHQNTLASRLRTTLRKSKEYQRSSRYEDQESSQIEEDRFFCHEINTIGWGNAFPASEKEDYLHAIDVWVEIDPTDLEIPERTMYLGIQRTLSKNPDIIDQKKQKIESEPIQIIPEHPERRKITRLLLVEEPKDYNLQYKNEFSFFQQLVMQQRREKRTSLPQAYAVLPGKTERDKKTMLTHRVMDIYSSCHTTLARYLSEHNFSSADRKLVDAQKELTARIIAKLQEDLAVLRSV